MKLTTKKLFLTGVAVLTMASISACGNTKSSETTAAQKPEVTTQATTAPAETKKEAKETTAAGETKKEVKESTSLGETKKEETSVGESKTSDSKVKADSTTTKGDNSAVSETESKKASN